MKPKYNIYQCNRCLNMEFSYFDNSVHRWCNAHDAPLDCMDIDDLTKKQAHCEKYNHPKGSKKKAKYLSKADYLRKYHE